MCARHDSPPWGFVEFAGPGKYVAEEDAADVVERALRRFEGRDLGRRERRDGAGGLRVDFVYDAATPPVALELWTITRAASAQLTSELRKLARRLDAMARDEVLGAWWFAVRHGSRVDALTMPLAELMRSMAGRTGICFFRDAHASPEEYGEVEVRNLPPELASLGVSWASWRSFEQGVAPITAVGDWEETGFGDLLRRGIDDNLSKLLEAQPREGHLAIVADASGLSSDPHATQPPKLPDGIESLWVILAYYNAKHTYRLWRTTHGRRAWTLMNHGLEGVIGVEPITHLDFS